ncbi:MAG: MarR family transcriptional regulator [Clostridiales Family XIII bacterium]|jgi:DNA-binding MarR family transcriptional regulator|nr:MarR family transcriptional regulator [Clostridiales Family XIII bacterium]
MAADADALRLENQICFPLYACAKEVVRKYKPYLDEIGLTYTQYIAMMVMWEHKKMNVKALGEKLYLDSGTLSPMLKKMEAAGLISRTRSAEDERNLIVSITEKGEGLKGRAAEIPAKMGACISITPEDAMALHGLLHRILRQM